METEEDGTPRELNMAHLCDTITHVISQKIGRVKLRGVVGVAQNKDDCRNENS